MTAIFIHLFYFLRPLLAGTGWEERKRSRADICRSPPLIKRTISSEQDKSLSSGDTHREIVSGICGSVGARQRKSVGGNKTFCLLRPLTVTGSASSSQVGTCPARGQVPKEKWVTKNNNFLQYEYPYLFPAPPARSRTIIQLLGIN